MEEIIATKFYSPKKLVKMGIVPWASAMTFKKRLQEPKWKALFNPLIDLNNGREMIYIKGENVLKFMELTGKFMEVTIIKKQSNAKRTTNNRRKNRRSN